MPETKQYTKSEVESNNGKGKTLIILHDKVYDITDFLNEHPGGEEILIDHGGQDGSVDFDDVGHSQDAFELMKKYHIGELVDSEKTHKEPKKSWTTSYTMKPQNTDQDSGMSTLKLLAGAAVLVAVLYYMYL